MKMHAGEIDIDEALVRRLVAGQFPELTELPITRFQSTGTVNALYRLGDGLYARLPRVSTWAEGVERELTWLPRLAASLSLRVPEPFARGFPTDEFPFTWAIYRWLPGASYEDDLVRDESRAARDLARFIVELRRLDPSDAPRTGRKPLRALDAVTRSALESSRGAIDADAALDAWATAVDSPEWDGTPVWIHTDLLRPNLLVENGRLSAVIDFGGIGVGDPAADVIAAWSVFNPTGRAVFRDALEVDEATWTRARGYALHQAALIIPYYPKTNPAFVAQAQRTIEQILAG
jgi:aminoglycoside phosphotransferase (APT) family kinase protein